jgi:hypothetical protein
MEDYLLHVVAGIIALVSLLPLTASPQLPPAAQSTLHGKNASRGAQSYIVDGRMTRGFALIAYPAKYGDSGIMTFIVSQDGIVYVKNLGLETASIARRIMQYDPDATWRAP